MLQFFKLNDIKNKVEMSCNEYDSNRLVELLKIKENKADNTQPKIHFVLFSLK